MGIGNELVIVRNRKRIGIAKELPNILLGKDLASICQILFNCH